MADDNNTTFSQTRAALDRLASVETVDRAIRALEIANATEHESVRDAALWIIRELLDPLFLAGGTKE